jgi:hypothetical protein
MKQEIKKYITQIYTGDLEGSIDEVIEYLERLKKENLGNYKYLEIDKSRFSDNLEFNLYGFRDETDEEYQARINVQNINKKVTEERERKLLESLKKKYENKE